MILTLLWYKKPVTSSKEIPKPSAHSRKDRLYHIPKLFHRKSLHFCIKIGGSLPEYRPNKRGNLSHPLHTIIQLPEAYELTVCSVSV